MIFQFKAYSSTITYKEILDNPTELELNLNYAKQQEKAGKIKKIGAIWLGLSNKVKSNREYKDLKSIWKMVERCAYEQLGKSIIILFFTILMMIIIYLSWILGLIIGIKASNLPVVLLSLFIFVISLITFFPTIRFYKINYFYCSLAFVSSIFYILMTISSAKNYYLNLGSVWKGRKY